MDTLHSGNAFSLAGCGAEEEEEGTGGAGDFTSSLSSPFVPWAAALAATEALLPEGEGEGEGGGRNEDHLYMNLYHCKVISHVESSCIHNVMQNIKPGHEAAG